MPELLSGPAGREDGAISLDRERTLLGTFRMRLDSILLPALSNREIRHAERLADIFKVQGCFRLDPRNKVEATIDRRTWGNVSSRGLIGPQHHRIPPELHLGLDEAVSCFSGKCRLTAARCTLDGNDRWWPVTLYRKGELCRAARQNLLLTRPRGIRGVSSASKLPAITREEPFVRSQLSRRS